MQPKLILRYTSLSFIFLFFMLWVWHGGRTVLPEGYQGKFSSLARRKQFLG